MSAASGVGNTAALLAGTISFLSPCVLPLVPAYLSYIAGEVVDEARDRPRHARLFTLALSAAFVVGFSLVFIALGASATAIGRILLQYKEEANMVAGVIVIVFGAFMLGGARWFAFLQRDFRFHVDRVAGNPVSAFVLGIAFAFGWTRASVRFSAPSSPSARRRATWAPVFVCWRRIHWGWACRSC